MKLILHLSILVLLTASCALSQGDSATEETQRDTSVYNMSPVIVTPTQATERLSPVTFSNLNQTELSEQYSTQDVPELLSQLPSSTFYSENGNGIGYNYLRLRGFDQRRISVMVNGIPQNDPEDHNVYWIDFPDLTGSSSSIQVQRGAGSAFYGPPAIGGSINMVTNPFTKTPGVTLESMFGFQEFGDLTVATTRLNTRKFTASVNSGLVDGRYMVYARLGRILSDGYRQQSWVNLSSYFLSAVRLDENSTTRINLYGGPITDALAYEGIPKSDKSDLTLRRANYSYGVPRRPQEIEGFSQPHYELMNEWRITPTVTLSNTLFYINGEGYFDYDASWADTTTLRLGSAYGIPATQNPANALVRGYVGNNQWGWLPRVQLDLGANTLTLGAELRIHRSIHWGKIAYAENLPSGFDPDYHFYEYNGSKNIFSLYAHDLYKLDDATTAMADIQMISNRYGIENEKYLHNSFTYPYFFVNPHIGVNRNFNDAWNGYVSLAYTSREPVLRNLYAAEDAYFGATPQFAIADTTGGVVRYDFARPYAKPERLLDVEVGSGYRVGGTTLTMNVYWMEFSDELVKSGQLDIFGQPVTGNAQKSRHIGVELEFSQAITPELTLNGNGTWSSNKLINYTTLDASNAKVSYDGNPISGFPDLLGNLRLAYRLNPVTTALSLKYVGPFYTDNTKDENNKNDAFVVMNTELLYRLPEIAGTRFTLRGEVNNIFNTLYFNTGEGSSFYPAAERAYLIGLVTSL